MTTTKKYEWTSPAGDSYKVVESDNRYHLYVNGSHTQQFLPNTVHFEEAVSRLVNMHNEADAAEVAFFKNHPELNP